MNINRPLYGRITIGNDRKSLGFATFDELMTRAVHTFVTTKSRASINIVLEVSENQLPATTLMNDEQRIESEFTALLAQADLDEDTAWPGIKLSRVVEVSATPEYLAYQSIATNPSRRIGVDQSTIDSIKSAYFELAPDCAPHFPSWID